MEWKSESDSRLMLKSESVRAGIGNLFWPRVGVEARVGVGYVIAGLRIYLNIKAELKLALESELQC